jgi:hypothetical protein
MPAIPAGVPRTASPTIPPSRSNSDSGQRLLSQRQASLELVQLQPALAGSASIAPLLTRVQSHRTALAAYAKERNTQSFLQRSRCPVCHAHTRLYGDAVVSTTDPVVSNAFLLSMMSFYLCAGVYHPLDNRFEEVVKTMNPYAITLEVGSIRFESPGFFEVLGSLNPLKLVADFITNWRAENTKRITIQSNETIQFEKVRAKFATDVLKMMPEAVRGESAHRIVEITNSVITPSALTLESIASDERVKQARLTNGKREK